MYVFMIAIAVSLVECYLTSCVRSQIGISQRLRYCYAITNVPLIDVTPALFYPPLDGLLLARTGLEVLSIVRRRR